MVPMSGSERRKKILHMLKNSSTPISGTAIGKETGVSRQIVVQDIALLRTEGHRIMAAARGYILEGPKDVTRVFKTCHTNEQTEEELQTIVDLGGCVTEVGVYHNVYGEMKAPLHIRNRRDIRKFMEQLRSGESVPLMNLTSGYHFHCVTAETEEILDEIQEELRKKHMLAEETGGDNK